MWIEMGKIKMEFESKYNRDDVVIFKKNGIFQVGIIEYSTYEEGAVWYTIALGDGKRYSFCYGGEIYEGNIVAKVEHEDIVNTMERNIKG